MKTIKIISNSNKSAIFTFGSYAAVIEDDPSLFGLPIFKMCIKHQFETAMDVRYWFENIYGCVFLFDYPRELIDFIKLYEEDLRYNSPCLFHDIRTKYIDFINLKAIESDAEDIKSEDIALVGYSILNGELSVTFRAFSIQKLIFLVERIMEYSRKHGIGLELSKRLKWLQIEQCMLPDTKLSRTDLDTELLKRTMKSEYFPLFREAFKIIDTDGYFDKRFYNKEVEMHNHTTKILKMNQFIRFFSRFWKTDISDLAPNSNNTILCLHDEMPHDDTVDSIVYTVKPHLKKYYQLYWFEDFCGEVISKLEIEGYRIVDTYAGKHFNFFQDGQDKNIREIDFLFEVEHEGIYKIIAVECKKTLTDREVRRTRQIIQDKILKSKINVIDAYINIGFYDKDMIYNEVIAGSNEKYSRNVIITDGPEYNDAVVFSFSIESIESFRFKIEYIIKQIFDEW